MRHIYFCESCKNYTMKVNCSCSVPTISSRPAKFSPIDKLGVYRREAKRLQREKTVSTNII
jgi:rRNA maturation protein Nop10